MAGSDPRFDAGRFREAITFVYEMAAAPEEEERAFFHFASQLVYTGEGGVDADGLPFDPDSTVQRQTLPPVQVPCAITYYDRHGEVTNLGVVTPSHVQIDVLDEHWEIIKDFIFVAIHGDKYVRRRVEPPSGLFDVGLYTIRCDAEDET